MVMLNFTTRVEVLMLILYHCIISITLKKQTLNLSSNAIYSHKQSCLFPTGGLTQCVEVSHLLTLFSLHVNQS